MDWRDVQSFLILAIFVSHAFVFNPITPKYGKFTHFWMLFEMTDPIFQFS